jgi:hypothetical protein
MYPVGLTPQVSLWACSVGILRVYLTGILWAYLTGILWAYLTGIPMD